MPLKVQRDDQTAINLTPMIDIVFLLIIFFMVSSHFTTNQSHSERDMAVSVPRVSDGEALTAPPRHRVVNIFSDGRIALDQQVVSMEELHSQLGRAKSQYSRLGVVVRGDGVCRWEKVAEIIATCRNLDVQLSLAVQNCDTIQR